MSDITSIRLQEEFVYLAVLMDMFTCAIRGLAKWLAERLMRTIKEEEVDLSEYEDDTDAVRQLGRFLYEVYMLQQHSFLSELPHPSRV